MEHSIIFYEHLPEDSAAIRREVFMEEQGFKNEFDDIDSSASHVVLYINDEPAVTGRFFKKHESNVWIVGRIAVRQKFRGRLLGSKILEAVENEISKRGGKKVMLAAQVKALPFYQKAGYEETGEPFMDEYCPHIWMRKEFVE